MRKDGERGIKNISKQTFCNNKEQKVYNLLESLIYEYRGPKRVKGLIRIRCFPRRLDPNPVFSRRSDPQPCYRDTQEKIHRHELIRPNHIFSMMTWKRNTISSKY